MSDIQRIREARPMSAADLLEWPALVSLDMPSLPRLDAALLPGWLGEFVRGLAAATETPPELPAAMALAAVSTAVARYFRVQVEPGYFEPCNLWLLVALPPANRKSAIVSATTAPLLDWEQHQGEAMHDEIQRLTEQRHVAEGRLEKLRKQAGKEDDPAERAALLEKVMCEAADLPEIPRPPLLWTSDVTPEKLADLLKANGERLAWLSSEAGIFDLLAGRYSGGVPNLDLILKSHSGDPDRVHRGTRPAVHLGHPLVTMGISPQPAVLRGLSSKPDFLGRGLLARFLYLLPPSPVGFRTLEPPPMPETVRAEYAAAITTLLDYPPAYDDQGHEQPHLLRLCDAAHREWLNFAKAMEVQSGPGGDFEHMTDWAGKAAGAAARLAGVLHVVEHARGAPEKLEIAPETVDRALELLAIIAHHAAAAYQEMGADTELEGARVLWEWIEQKRLPEFSERDAFNAKRRRFPRVKDLRPALEVLSERGYIQAEPEPERETGQPGRKPSPRYFVRPELVRGWSA